MPRPKKQHLKQRADGRYRCKYKDRVFYGSTEAEAFALRDEYKRMEEEGLSFSVPTVAEYALQWLPLHKANVSKKCYADYAAQLAALAKAIGDYPLNAVTVDIAATVWPHYADYSASTIKRAKMLFIALFDTAIENDYCRKNPFRSKFAAPPKGASGSHRALTQDEITLIRNTPHRMQLAVMVMLYAGLRRGEALALSSDDIQNKMILVSKAVRFSGNRADIVSPKTAAGSRMVPVLSPLAPLLKGHKGLIAPSSSGKIMTSSAFKRAWDSYIHALTQAAGHPVAIRPHDLRHTYCTMLRDAGVDMKQAMIWLGHSDEKMILRIYDHAGERRAATSIKQVEKLLKPLKK